ncbi:MAG TPA: hypothetical protein VGM90_10060 [Kofleriaceae bacterium]|jgi:hypothetical protein
MAADAGEVTSGTLEVTLLVRDEVLLAEHRDGSLLTVRRADGSEFQLLVNDETRFVAQPAGAGVWSEVRDMPVAKNLSRAATGDDQFVTIERVSLAPGKRVRFDGEDGGINERPDGSQVPIIRATLVSVGTAGTKPHPRERDLPAAPAAIAPAPSPVYVPEAGSQLALVAGFLLLAGASIYEYVSLGFAPLAIAIAALGSIGILLLARGGPKTPLLWSGDKAIDPPLRTSIWLGFAAVVLGAPAVTLPLVYLPLVMIAVQVACAVLLVALGKELRMLRNLADAPSELSNGALATVMGTLVGDKIVASATRTTRRFLQSESIIDHVNVERFSFDLPDRTRIMVDPADVVWGSTVDREMSKEVNFDAKRSRIDAGARVAAYGQFTRISEFTYKLVSLGSEPAVVLASPSNGDPIAFANALVKRQRTDLMILALSIVVQAGLIAVLAL